MWLLAKIAVTPLAGVWIEIAVLWAASMSLSSLPLRECGLKCPVYPLSILKADVTPLAGVWIEISLKTALQLQIFRHSPCGSVDWNTFIGYFFCLNHVTPLAGVWIEINSRNIKRTNSSVTPLAGVWIEIQVTGAASSYARSHSPCGSVDWNYGYKRRIMAEYVTPLAGVWIEIENIDSMVNRVYVTPLAGVWIEITSHYTIIGGDWSLPLRECGLKLVSAHMGARTGGHSPCGSVDWNEPEVQKVLQKWVTPLAGVWIEIVEVFYSTQRSKSLPLRECGLKSTKKSDTCCQIPVTPLAGVWIEICRDNKCRFLCCVTPLAGVWIEIE